MGAGLGGGGGGIGITGFTGSLTLVTDGTGADAAVVAAVLEDGAAGLVWAGAFFERFFLDPELFFLFFLVSEGSIP